MKKRTHVNLVGSKKGSKPMTMQKKRKAKVVTKKSRARGRR